MGGREGEREREIEAEGEEDRWIAHTEEPSINDVHCLVRGVAKTNDSTD